MDISEITRQPDTAWVIRPYLPTQTREAAAYRLEEMVSLAEAIGLEVVLEELTRVTAVRPATYIGKGAAENFRLQMEGGGRPEVIVVDAPLSPIQQRNLERLWNVKVIDRTGLILEIFGLRARTGEGHLQVELARLSYQRSRLVRAWSHLERQRGGSGKTGGPGESQLELDRRMIDDRIIQLKERLEKVQKTRALHREARQRVPYPIVALVGYTNAGKSTLFNALTGAEVFAADQVFATLDPTMRLLKLPSGRSIILSDTVGFISDLPTELVAAFRATLEEVCFADVLLHVRDISHPEWRGQEAAVRQVLHQLGWGDDRTDKIILVNNKIDLCPSEGGPCGEGVAEGIGTSAMRGWGLDALKAAINGRLGAEDEEHQIVLPYGATETGRARAWLHAHGQVLSESETEDAFSLKVRLSGVQWVRFQKAFQVAGETF